MKDWATRLDEINNLTADNLINDLDKNVLRIYLNLYKSTLTELLKIYVDLQENPMSRSTLYNYKHYYQFHNQLVKKLTEMGIKLNNMYTETLTEAYTQVQLNIKEVLPNSNIIDRIVPLAKVTQVLNTDWVGDGKTYSMRIWKNQDLLLESIERGINECVVRGDNKDQWIQRLMDEFNTGHYNAKRLAVTEIMRAMTQGALDRYKELGIKEVEILTAEDEKVCEHDKELNHKKVPIDLAVPGKNVPCFHPNCRCTIIPVL